MALLYHHRILVQNELFLIISSYCLSNFTFIIQQGAA
jgi:hypothetical protein